jgi:hypothetical protein
MLTICSRGLQYQVLKFAVVARNTYANKWVRTQTDWDGHDRKATESQFPLVSASGPSVSSHQVVTLSFLSSKASA